MINGEFIKDRWIVGIVRELAKSRNISFLSWSDDWLIELRKDWQRHYIIGYRFGLNNSAAATISQDKVGTYAILAANNIPAIPHVLVRTKVSEANQTEMNEWQQVVIKPLEGTSGHGVRLCNDVGEAMQAIEASPIQAWAAAPYVAIEREVRLIILEGKVLLAYEKIPTIKNGLKMFNLGIGATPAAVLADTLMTEIALSAQSALGLRLCAVDIVQDSNGMYKVLEINDAIMMEHYARYSAQNKDRAIKVYDAIVERMFE